MVFLIYFKYDPCLLFKMEWTEKPIKKSNKSILQCAHYCNYLPTFNLQISNRGIYSIPINQAMEQLWCNPFGFLLVGFAFGLKHFRDVVSTASIFRRWWCWKCLFHLYILLFCFHFTQWFCWFWIHCIRIFFIFLGYQVTLTVVFHIHGNFDYV